MVGEHERVDKSCNNLWFIGNNFAYSQKPTCKKKLLSFHMEPFKRGLRTGLSVVSIRPPCKYADFYSTNFLRHLFKQWHSPSCKKCYIDCNVNEICTKNDNKGCSWVILQTIIPSIIDIDLMQRWLPIVFTQVCEAVQLWPDVVEHSSISTHVLLSLDRV